MSTREERDELARSVHGFLATTSPPAAVRRLMASGEARDEAVWSRMAGELGLQGLVVPEALGGSGYGPEELAVVLEETGGALLVAPFLATVLATQALIASADASAMARWLPGIADGSITAALAVTGEDGRFDLAHPPVRARDGVLHGSALFVVDGLTADLLVVAAADHDRTPNLYAVEGGADGLTRTAHDTLDPTRPLARLDLDAVTATCVATGADTMSAVTDLAAVAVAAEQVGGAQRCLDLTVDYAKVRVQFGRPIGSFQAVKHRLADVLLAVESARSAVRYAASVLGGADARSAEASVAASLAKAVCSEAYTTAAKAAIQLHGGIGYTWEHDAQLHLKRAKSAELLFGAPAEHRARLGRLVGIA